MLCLKNGLYKYRIAFLCKNSQPLFGNHSVKASNNFLSLKKKDVAVLQNLKKKKISSNLKWRAERLFKSESAFLDYSHVKCRFVLHYCPLGQGEQSKECDDAVMDNMN